MFIDFFLIILYNFKAALCTAFYGGAEGKNVDNTCDERKSVMDSDGFAGSLIILALILVKAFTTVCEYAVTEVSDSKVKNFENGSKAEKRLFRLLEHPSRVVTAFSVNRIFSAVLIAYAAVIVYSAPLGRFIDRHISGNAVQDGISTVSLILSYIIILTATVFALTVFCEGLPKKLAASANAEKLAVKCGLAVKIILVLFTPLTALSGAAVKLLAGLFGSKVSEAADSVTEEEILMMVDAGNETGVIEESQKEMINNVFEFSDLTVSDVMTHRTDIVGVETEASVSDVVNAAISSGFSRIPVYEGSMDRITGIICVKDLLCMVGSDAASGAKAKDFLREMIYVPESMTCGELFKQFSAKKMQMAVVADEYGGTAGIVTMEDVVETIVGNIQDEYDDEEEEIKKISDDTYTVSGTASPEAVFEQLGLTLPEGSDFDTMSGFIVDLLGRIPEENENPSVRYENVLFTVLITEDMCISKLKAEICGDDTSDKNENNINTKEKKEEHEYEEKN